MMPCAEDAKPDRLNRLIGRIARAVPRCAVVFSLAWATWTGSVFGAPLTTDAPGSPKRPASSNQGVSLEHSQSAVVVGEQTPTRASGPLTESQVPPVFEDATTLNVRESMDESMEAGASMESPLLPVLRKRRAPQGAALSERRNATDRWYQPGIGALSVVLVLVGALYLGLRRWSPSLRVSDRGVLRVVARTGLTPKHHLALVQLGRRFVLVGTSQEQVATLCEVTDPIEVAELAAQTSVSSAGGGNGFHSQLEHMADEFRDSSELRDGPDDAGEIGLRVGAEVPARVPALAELRKKLRVWQRR